MDSPPLDWPGAHGSYGVTVARRRSSCGYQPRRRIAVSGLRSGGRRERIRLVCEPGRTSTPSGRRNACGPNRAVALDLKSQLIRTRRGAWGVRFHLWRDRYAEVGGSCRGAGWIAATAASEPARVVVPSARVVASPLPRVSSVPMMLGGHRPVAVDRRRAAQLATRSGWIRAPPYQGIQIFSESMISHRVGRLSVVGDFVKNARPL